MNSIILEDIVLNYTPEYDGDYVDVNSATLNGVTINVDTQRESLSVPLTINGENTLIENCTINANLPSTQIPWEVDPEILEIPQGTGILITEGNVTLRNNVIQVSESSIIDASGYYKSLYGIYIGGDYTTLCNNTVLMTGTQYCYGVVIRSLNNIMSDNNVYVESEYYAAGINIEGNAIKNNLICGNNIDVSAGYNETDMENPDVAYGCLILDFSYGGGDYVASISSMENNRYINNTVIADARQSYAFELWGGVNTQIIGNNMTSTGNYPMGIGAIGINTTIDNNTIIADGISNYTEFSADWIKPRTAGIYVYGKMEGNTITNNTVAVTNGRAIQLDNAKNILVENNFLLSEDYAYVIEVTNGTNTFKYNTIMGEGTTEEVIKDTSKDENIYINNREATTSTLTINTPENIIIGYETQITISLKDEEEKGAPNQYITVQIGEEEAQTLITDKHGNCIFPYTMTTQTAQITATYECYQNFGCTTTKEIHTIEPIILTPENFDTYITNGLLNENVPKGATIDVHGKFDNERYAFNITKPVNMLSTTGDAFFCFYSTPKLEGTSELPDYSFIITSEGSGTNITGINFENTMIVTKEAHDIIFDNITVYCTSGYGWGRGSTSIRNSQNVTIKNSYFNTTDNNGVSTVVFAASQNCLIENSTVCGSGFIGNLVYATTYNVEVIDEYGNSNITIRGNKIIGRDIAPGVATCYSVCLIGDNITVEDNYIENSNSYLIMTQYKDDEYEVAGNTGTLTIRNNEFDAGKISIKFDPCTIENNTFYGNVTITATNNTITNNNIQVDESQNPYKNTTNNVHQTSVTIDAPDTYIYNDEITVNITVKDTTTNETLTNGLLEIYTDGTPYKNITINSNTTSFTYNNETIGIHRIRAWYYSPTTEINNSQKVASINATPILGELTLTTKENPQIGETITLTATYTLNKEVPLTTDFKFELPGHQPITITTDTNTATLNTTITTDYIRDILGGREQNIKITATTNNTNVEITGINTKLGVTKAQTSITITPTTTQVNNQTTITATINTPTNLTINTGTITFKDAENNTIGTYNVNNNQATITTQFNTIGTTQITATYSGTTYYETTTTTTPIEVTGKQEVIVTYEPINNVNYGENVTITGKFTTNTGKAITNSNVKIYINGVKYLAKTDKTVTYLLSVETTQTGVNKVSIGYSGNDKYEAYETNTTFTVTA